MGVCLCLTASHSPFSLFDLQQHVHGHARRVQRGSCRQGVGSRSNGSARSSKAQQFAGKGPRSRHCQSGQCAARSNRRELQSGAGGVLGAETHRRPSVQTGCGLPQMSNPSMSMLKAMSESPKLSMMSSCSSPLPVCQLCHGQYPIPAFFDGMAAACCTSRSCLAVLIVLLPHIFPAILDMAAPSPIVCSALFQTDLHVLVRVKPNIPEFSAQSEPTPAAHDASLRRQNQDSPRSSEIFWYALKMCLQDA
jgi:hypothetical protein